MDVTRWEGLELSAGSVVVQTEPAGPVLYLRGDIDAAVMNRWESERTADDEAIVAVDVSALTYIDSSGISFLVRWAKEQSRAGRPATIRGAISRFDQVLDLIGLSHLFVRER